MDKLEALVQDWKDLRKQYKLKKREVILLKDSIPQDKYYESSGIKAREAYNRADSQ